MVLARGHFLSATTREALVVRDDGLTNGANGGMTAYLYPEAVDGASWLGARPRRIITRFPADQCAPVARPQRTDLVLCSFSYVWQGAPFREVALADLSAPLHEDPLDGSGRAGWLSPLQTLIVLREQASTRFACPWRDGFPVAALAPYVTDLRVFADGRGFSFDVRAPVFPPEAMSRACEALERAPDRPLTAGAIRDAAARELGPAKVVTVSVATSAGGALRFADSSTAPALRALGFEVP